MTTNAENDLQWVLFDIAALMETVALLAEEIVHNGLAGHPEFDMAKVHAVERLSRQAQQMLNAAADEVPARG